MKYSKYILAFCLSIMVYTSIAQNNNEPVNDSKREEIQRYFGYEKLLLRYYTTPFDISMNVNERGNFLDIGFLYLMFLPVLLLLLYWKNKLFVILSILCLTLLLIVSTSNAFIYDSQNVSLLENKDGQFLGNPDISFNISPIDAMAESIYEFNNQIYKFINPLISSITGERDYITYPLLILLFGLYSFFFLRRISIQDLKPKHLIIVIVWFYSFLWFILSAGIVWYGYLMLILAMLLIVEVIDKLDTSFALDKFVKNSFYSLATIWIIIGFINRVSNISPATPTEHQGKGIYNPSFYTYAAGLRTENQTIGSLYPYLDHAVSYMNNQQNKDALVYRVGTSFTYFIENNNERVLIDNQLGFFSELVKKYPEKKSLARALRASEFKFIIVDLFTPTIDRTPERSLTKKYNLFMNFIYKNELLALRGTDRLVKAKGSNDQPENGIFGDIVSNGSYAIFEILP